MFTSASGDTVGDSNTQFGFHNAGIEQCGQKD